METPEYGPVLYTPSKPREFIYQNLMDVDARRQKPFLFSIVVAVYNAAPFLDETIQSVLSQDIGFDANIQLILVDDGSKDESLDICLKYGREHPENIVVVHKENGGVSSARNAGLHYVSGKYINFLDSDDHFSPNVCSEVAKFFQIHGRYTDIVAVRTVLCGAKTGKPGLFDKKFEKGNRVINLWKEPEIYQNSTNNCFFSSILMNWFHFDESIDISEDLKLINVLLMRRYALGVLSSASYYYRISSDGASLASSARKKPTWYFPYLERVVTYLLDVYQTKAGFVPAYVQYTLLRDLYNRFNGNKEFELVIKGKQEKARYEKLLFSLLSRIDDSVILKNAFLNSNWQVYFLSIKHGAPKMEFIQEEGKIKYTFEGGATITQTMFQCFTFATIQDRKFTLEGYVTLPNWHKEVDLELQVRCGEDQVSGGFDEGVRFDNLAFGNEYWLYRHYYKFEIDHPGTSSDVIEFTLLVNGNPLSIPLNGYGDWFPLTKKLPDPFYCKNGLCLSTWGPRLVLSHLEEPQRIEREEKTWEFLAKDGSPAALAALEYRKAYEQERAKKHRKEIWIVTDRHVCGGDNGEAFYRYLLKEKSKQIDAYFALDGSSPDFERLQNEGFKMIDMTSEEYKKLFVLADCILSSYFDHSEYRPISNEFVRSIVTMKHFVFLQHGITKDDVSFYYTRNTMNFSLFITAAERERASIVETPNYLLSSEKVALTGFPRYDLLENHPKKLLLVMPTWRNKMVQFGMNGQEPVVHPSFPDSYYYHFYHELLSSPRLHEACKKHGYALCYFPHNNMLATDSYFKDIEGIEIREGEDRVYSKAFAEASVMVTDFSSTAFDFAYLRKPVIYVQGDAEEFFSSHTYRKGYFDYEKDGFGPVLAKVEEAVSYLERLMEQDCKPEEKYLERINSFFAFDDKENCRRVFDAVAALN